MNITKLIFMFTFALVLLLTGSILINFYINVKSSVFTADNIDSNATFHWWIGVLSIITGIICFVFSVYYSRSFTVDGLSALALRNVTPVITNDPGMLRQITGL